MLIILSDKQFSKEYNEIYEAAQILFDRFNPCQMDADNCGEKRISNSSAKYCCSGCRHLRKDGCGVKSLICKLWLCSWALRNIDKEFEHELSLLKKRAQLIGYSRYGSRFSKTSSLKLYQFLRSHSTSNSNTCAVIS